MVGKLKVWPDFTSKLIKWTCLCELYPYRMSLLVLIATDFEQKQTVNRLAAQREGKDDGGRSFFRYIASMQIPGMAGVAAAPGKAGAKDQDVDVAGAASSTGEANPEIADIDDEYISTFYNKHVERFVYSLGVSQKMLRLDGDAELFQTLLMLPVPSGDASSTEDESVDICIADILGPPLNEDRDSEQSPEQTTEGKLNEQFGINKRDANLSRGSREADITGSNGVDSSE